MSTTAQDGFNLGALNAEIRSRWGWFVALGVALLILAFLAFSNLIVATIASVFMVGVLMTVGAVIEIAHAFRVRRWGGFFFWLLGGVLYGVAGILTFYNPLLAAAVLTLVLAIALIAAGILRVWASIRMRPLRGWGWITASGIITIAAGVVFALGWPANTLFLLGIVLAVDLTFQGVAAIAFGMALKANRRDG